MKKKEIMTVTMLPMSLVFEPVEALRLNISMESIRELAESIREQGLQIPVLVRPVDGKYEIVTGHRRFLAHQFLSATKIKAEVRELNEEETAILRATENLQREDLTPMEEARAYGLLHTRLHMAVEAIARNLGRNPNTIRRYLNLLELPDVFQKAIDIGEVAIGVAEILAQIDDPELQTYYMQNAAISGCSIKTAKVWLADYEATKAAQYYMEPRKDVSAMLNNELKPTYYACDLCSQPIELSRSKHLMACPLCVGKMRIKLPYQE